MPFSNQRKADGEAEDRVQEDVEWAEAAEEKGDQDEEKPLEAEECSSDFLLKFHSFLLLKVFFQVFIVFGFFQ